MTETVITLPAAKARHRPWLLNSKLPMVAVSGLLALALLILIGPLVWHYKPNAVYLTQELQPPSTAHPLGTDDMGQDVLARFFTGGRISLGAHVVIVLPGAVPGCIARLLAAFRRRSISS